MAGADTNRAASDPSDKATKEQQEFLALCIAAIEGTYSGTSTIAEKSKQRDVLEAPTSATDDAFSTAIATALQHPEQRPPRQYLPAGQNTHLATPTIVVQHVQQGSDSLTEAVVKQQESLQMLTATLRNVFPGPYTAALQSSHPELLKQSSLAIGNVSSAAPTGEIDYREHLSPKQSKSVGQTALSATASAAAPDALTETAIKHERSSDTPLATVETAAVQCAKPKFLRQFSLPIRSVSPATFRTMSQSIAHGTPKLSTLAEEDPFVKALNATKQYQLGIKPVSQAAQESKGTWDEPLAGKTCPKKKYFCCICLGGFTRPGTIQGRHFTQCARRYGNPFDLPWNTHPSCQPGSEYKVEELSAFLTQYHKEYVINLYLMFLPCSCPWLI